MSKQGQFMILVVILTLLNCEQKTELPNLEFEQKVFYYLFPELSDIMYSDIRLTPTPPPPSPEYLTEKGFDAEIDYNSALEDWEKSDDYRNKLKNWIKKRDSIINDTTLIYIAIPDSINHFKREDMYELINHFNDQKLVVDYEEFELEMGFKVSFDKLKSDNEKLRFKPLSKFPERSEFWTTKYDFNFRGSLSFSRILFDKTKSYGVLNAGFMKGRLNGGGCRIFIRKDKNGNWVIDKIKGTWIS